MSPILLYSTIGGLDTPSDTMREIKELNEVQNRVEETTTQYNATQGWRRALC